MKNIRDTHPGPDPPKIELTEEQEQHLQEVVNRSTSEYREHMRARIILFANEGHSNREISEKVGCHENTVGKWRRRFKQEGPKGLTDRQRPGRPSKFSAEQKSKIIEKAVQTPGQEGYPFSHWDASALADLAEEADIVDEMSPSTIWRLLQEADLQPHRSMYWLNQDCPDFTERMKDVTGVYLNAIENNKEGIKTISIDEKTGIQALERTHPDLNMKSGKIQRIEHHYRRHGTRDLTAGFDVATGEIGHYELSDHHKDPFFADFLLDMGSTYKGAEKIHVVCDQLAIHSTMQVCEAVAQLSERSLPEKRCRTQDQRRSFLMEQNKRVEFHYTPKHASWLNQIEIWFGILTRKLLNRSSFEGTDELDKQVEEFIRHHNNNRAHPYKWTYTGTPLKK